VVRRKVSDGFLLIRLAFMHSVHRLSTSKMVRMDFVRKFLL